MAVMCRPGCSHAASISASRDGVVVTTTSDMRTTSSALGAVRTGMPSAPDIRVAKNSAFVASRAHTRISGTSRTSASARICNSAWIPAPMTPARRIVSGAR
jgi:hypothetical protein